MRSARWDPDGLSVVDVDPGPLPPGYARLRVEACGICGSDLKLWTRQLPAVEGTAPGHEFVGTIIDGPGGLADVRYAASPIVTCGSCEFCLTSQWNLCRRGGDLIGLGRNGGVAEWVDVPIQNLIPLGGDLDVGVAVLAEPMAVAVRGVGMAPITSQTRVLVLGGGTIGLLAAAVAATRSDDVTISVRHPQQRAAAARLGVTVIDEPELMGWGKQSRPDVVVETVGGEATTLDDAIAVVRRGGTIIVLGTFLRPSVNLFAAGQKEAAIISSFAYGTTDGQPDFLTGAGLLSDLTTSLDGIVTHRFPLDEVATAFEHAHDKSSGALKVAILPTG